MYSLESKCLPFISGKHFEIISSMNVYFLHTWIMYTFGVIDYCYDFTFNFLFHCQLNSIYWFIVYTLTCDCSCHGMNVEMRGQFAGHSSPLYQGGPGIKLELPGLTRRTVTHWVKERSLTLLLCSLRDWLLDPFASVVLCLTSKNSSCVTFSLHPLFFPWIEHAVTSWKCNIYDALKFVCITLILNSLAPSFLSPHMMLLFCLYWCLTLTWSVLEKSDYNQDYRTMVWLEEFYINWKLGAS